MTSLDVGAPDLQIVSHGFRRGFLLYQAAAATLAKNRNQPAVITTLRRVLPDEKNVQDKLGYLIGAVDAHGALPTAIFSSLVEDGSVQSDRVLSALADLKKFTPHYTDNPQLGIGYQNTLRKAEAALRRFV